MPAPLGEFEQLVLMAIVRLEDDAYGATVRREIEARNFCSARRLTLGKLKAAAFAFKRIRAIFQRQC